ncbi:MAG TPA: pilus assembly protein PilP [Wenzhouxiangella sp.]|nr:pilus assembly protein PilP [Wenzhouxiangella sp.]
MNQLTRVFLLLLLAAILAGCQRGTGDLQDWTREMRAREAEPIEPVPPLHTPEPVVYNAADARDPFRAAIRNDEDDADAEEDSASTSDGPRPIPNRRKEYLEGFPLDTLEMVGTMTINDTLFALVQDNESVVHRVKEGDYMGQNHGLVKAVRSGQVEVRELVRDGRGGWQERSVRVTMPEDN